MVRIVSSSAADGPGPVMSRGFTERRVFRSSMASGTFSISLKLVSDPIAWRGADDEAVRPVVSTDCKRRYFLCPGGAGVDVGAGPGRPGMQDTLPIALGPY